jgi:hypothetical protein
MRSKIFQLLFGCAALAVILSIAIGAAAQTPSRTLLALSKRTHSLANFCLC